MSAATATACPGRARSARQADQPRKLSDRTAIIGQSRSAQDRFILKAPADPTRLRLVSMVAAHEGGEACACDLTEPLGLTQPTISHHLKILLDAGIFTRDQRGKWAYYALVPGALDAVSAVLSASA